MTISATNLKNKAKKFVNIAQKNQKEMLWFSIFFVILRPEKSLSYEVLSHIRGF